ncbi:hypothetical protein FAZ19_02665 [Sphingobacterium alkalisoli]|uniref:DUF5683 domain-containing protein n=1 Tax=Sphingobacterium alkalisoli TaxID=1874115 RepID=A0A4U0H8T7_9SPHI|nr:DUF5683 domain-containing protein [Sphingobacterium alkalisoli]TJY68176.1 hypothetical protein FAZ19_02665 [Sphingobacterium alkalisoli]GGH08508.1 hypothetical protein GCM10011418_05980 [Sphingobacterium alkalisoli]
MDSVVTAVDSVAQDTVKKETRQERRAREKAEKERAKFYYKDILKDSTRLAIEELSRVAWKRSLILPGWGQYTNGGLWWIKIPIIYGGFAGAYFTFDYWQWYYRKFLDEATYRINNNNAVSDPDLERLSLEYLIQSKDNARRNRDLTILATVGFWGLNVVEAYVNSMLKNRYNMGDNLSVKVSPTFMPSGYLGYQSPLKNQFVPGVKLTFNIR